MGIELKYQKIHPQASITKAYEGDACFDVKATAKTVTGKYVEYRTGLVFNIPKGYYLAVYARSSIRDTVLDLANSVGIIDTDY